MPNNANARREKDKKKKDKEKKTSPPPLHKEDKASNKDKASMDSKSLSSFLSLAGTYKEGELLVPGPAQSAFMLAFNRSLTEDEQHSITVQVAMENPGASPQELIAATRHAFKLKAGLEALKKKRHGEMDSSLSLSL